MNVFAKFDEIPSMILEVIKETKRFRHTVGRTLGQRENSIPSHKGGEGGGYNECSIYMNVINSNMLGTQNITYEFNMRFRHGETKKIKPALLHELSEACIKAAIKQQPNNKYAD